MAKGNPNGAGKKRGRKSKAESATGAKEAKAEMRTASETNELDLPKPDDIVFHMKAIKGWKERISTLQGSMRNAIKSAKKVNKFLPEVINELLALERLDDPSEFKRRMESLGVGLKAIGSPYQLTLHDTLLGDVQDVAYKRGKDDALNGRGSNNPYPQSSDLAESYDTGWRNGIGNTLGLTDAQTEAAVEGEGDTSPHPIDHNERNGLVEEPAAA